MSILDYIKDRLSIFLGLYDMIRVVDPVTKKVIANDDFVDDLCSKCYDFWKRSEFCENCISMRAHINSDTFVKISNKEEKVFLVISTPIIVNGKNYVVEILKDITLSSKIQIRTDDNSNYVDFTLSEMNEKIIKDDLTKIYNRRYISERLPVDINNSVLKQQPLSVIMVDIDFFKVINDNYGHLIGDKVLRDFAEIIQNSIRKEQDWAGRYGGEEFLIVLNNTESKDAYKVSEKIRKLIENKTLVYDDIKIKITASFGVYGLVTKNIDMENLIKEVDKNLYAAKVAGRNRTVIS